MLKEISLKIILFLCSLVVLLMLLAGCNDSNSDDNTFLRIKLNGEQVPENVEVFLLSKNVVDHSETFDLKDGRPTTSIRFDLPNPSRVNLTIYDIEHELIKKIADDYMEQGSHQVAWNGTDEDGNYVVSGLYYYRLTLLNNDDETTNSLEREMYLITLENPNEMIQHSTLKSMNKKPFLNLYSDLEMDITDYNGEFVETITEFDTTLVYLKDSVTGNTQKAYFVAKDNNNELNITWNPTDN